MKKKKVERDEEATEWNLSEGMGILPEDIPFTQNIGCVGGKSKSVGKENKKPKK
jgi:hypothetical protein